MTWVPAHIISGTFIDESGKSAVKFVVNNTEYGRTMSAGTGIGQGFTDTEPPIRTLEVFAKTGNPQVRIAYNRNNKYFDFQVDADPLLSILSGKTEGYVRIGTKETSNAITGGNSLLVSGDLEVDGNIYADGKVTIDGVLKINTIKIGGVLVTATPAELNQLSGAVPGIAAPNSVAVLGADRSIDYINFTTISVGGAAITATPAELNILAGVTVNTSELNKLAGLVTNTTELNRLSGLTADAIELNKLDGATVATSELNLLAGTSIGVAVASKVAVLGTNKELDELHTSALYVGAGAGTLVTSTADELNLLDGTSANADRIYYGDGSKITSSSNLQYDGKLFVKAPSAANTAEEIARFRVADDSDSYFKIINGTTADGYFAPKLLGYFAGTTMPGLTLHGDALTDSGTVPIVAFNASIAGGAASTRPLFQWQENGTARMTMDAAGNLGIGTTDIESCLGGMAQLGYSSAIMWGSSWNELSILSNAYFNPGGDWSYRLNGAASRIKLGTNVYFSVADSGVADNMIGWKESIVIYGATGIPSMDYGLRTKVSTANTANPPTAAQLTAAFTSPTTVGVGFHAMVDDNNAHANVYSIWSDGTNWWYATLTKAV
jgi:hypothetical protein